MTSTTQTPGASAGRAPAAGMKFSDILADPRIAERWQKVRKWFFLRESTYDMTNRCNIRCNGCYYYEGDKQFAREHRDVEAWRELMRSEKRRGITFVVLAGAEPALVPELCEVCYQEIPLGAIATNGLAVIPRSVGYKVHVSVWGTDETSLRVRKAARMLERQIEHPLGLHALFGCSYPRMNPATDVGLGRTFRQYRTDLTWDRGAACCVPDTDCADCRHYAAGSAVVTARMFRHATDPVAFAAWLDYVDTYLAVWVTGYEKGANLSNVPVAPPGFGLE